MFALMTAIANGQREGWTSDGILGWFALALTAAAIFIASQRRPGAALLNIAGERARPRRGEREHTC